MATITAIIRRSKKNDLGECPVWIRISDRDGDRYVSTGERVKPANWNDRKQEVRKADALHEEKNAVIRRKREEVERERLRIIIEDDLPPTPERIKAAVTKADAVPDFFEFSEAHLTDLERLGKVGRYRRLKSTLRKLEEVTGRPLPFDRITPRLLTDFETDCLSRLGNKASTVETNLTDIRTLINRAITHRVIDASLSPFTSGFKITKGEAADRTRLSFAEVTRIQNLELEEGSMAWHVRNLWLFAFFVGGIRFGDVVQMTAGRIVAGTGGAPDRLAFRAGKTGKPQSIKITPPARRIIEEYIEDDTDPDDFIFPLLRGYDLSSPKKLYNAVASRNTIANRALKEIGKAAGITESLTTHAARHSFADFARTSGWSLYDISKALQHHSVTQTEAYLKAFDSDSLDKGMDHLFGEVEG